MNDNPTAAYARKLAFILVSLIVGGTVIMIVAGVGLDGDSGKKDRKASDGDAAVTESLTPVGSVNIDEAPVMDGTAAVEAKLETAAATVSATDPDATVAAAAAPEAVSDARGKEVYDAACFVCHATGVAGAPKFGDPRSWSARIGQGTDTLYTHAIDGFMGKTGLMPARGGRMDYSDDDVKAAVDYMVNATASQ